MLLQDERFLCAGPHSGGEGKFETASEQYTGKVVQRLRRMTVRLRSISGVG